MKLIRRMVVSLCIVGLVGCTTLTTLNDVVQLKKIVVSLCVVAFSGCYSTLSTVKDADQSAGISKEFNSDIESTKLWALTSVERLNINIIETFENKHGFNILFSKDATPMLYFAADASSGEVGRVLIYAKGDSTMVSVHSRARVITLFTGTDEQDFATAIFTGMNDLISR